MQAGSGQRERTLHLGSIVLQRVVGRCVIRPLNFDAKYR